MLSTFPTFKLLTLDDRDAYEQLVLDYPPYSDISFATLRIWWNVEDKLEIAVLNGNIVMHYFIPDDQANTGYSLIGHNQVDDSIAAIFAWQRDEHKKQRLVHVPEFVIDKLDHRDRLNVVEELEYNEYVLDSKALSTLEGALHGRTRRKVGRFLREVENREVEIKPLDLSNPDAKDKLFDAVIAWEHEQPTSNDPRHAEHAALKRTFADLEALDIKHLGLYIDGVLSAVILYQRTRDSKYYIMNHLKVDYSIPYIFDYMTHCIAKKAVEDNIDFLNMEMDLGIENLRRHKMGLRPVAFFRKFTVTPAD